MLSSRFATLLDLLKLRELRERNGGYCCSYNLCFHLISFQYRNLFSECQYRFQICGDEMGWWIELCFAGGLRGPWKLGS